MTRKLEEDMQKIYDKKIQYESVLDETKKIIKKVCEEFIKKEKEIGKEIYQANIIALNEKNTYGLCPKCQMGQLSLRKGKFGEFIACNSYPECKTTISIPSGKKIISTDKVCEHDNYPLIKLANKKGRKIEQILCINKECPGKEESEENEKDEIEGSACNKCKDGIMIKRKGIYGTFYGCNNYPKCKNIMKSNNNNNRNEILA